MNNLSLDPRIKGVFQHRSPAEQFLAIALTAILAKIDPELLESTIDGFVQKDPDWNEAVVAGRPLLHFNGRTAVQLITAGESPKVVKRVVEMYEERGLVYTVGDVSKLTAEQRKPYAKVLEQLGWKEPKAVTTKPTDSSAPPADAGTGGDDGDKTGAAPNAVALITDGAEMVIAGRKLSEYAGKSDEDLLKMENVGPATVRVIRTAQANSPKA